MWCKKMDVLLHLGDSTLLMLLPAFALIINNDVETYRGFTPK
jgi:hypothetical protein